MFPLYKALGYIGIIPIFMAAVGGLFLHDTWGAAWLLFQLLYSGLSMTFYSGVHWAQSFRRSNEDLMVMSMVPATLAAFITCLSLIFFQWEILSGLVLNIVYSSFLLIYIVMFLLMYVLDAHHMKKEDFPIGYFGFRLRITLMVSSCLCVSIAAIWL